MHHSGRLTLSTLSLIYVLTSMSTCLRVQVGVAQVRFSGFQIRGYEECLYRCGFTPTQSRMAQANDYARDMVRLIEAARCDADMAGHVRIHSPPKPLPLPLPLCSGL